MMSPLGKDLCSLTGIQHPIIQAPMATASTPALAIAVSNAGALGSLAGGLLGPGQLRSCIRQIRAGTSQPFNVNLFAMRSAPPEPLKLARAQELIAKIERETGADQFEYAPPPRPPLFEEQLAIVIEQRVPVCSFTFGVPTASQLEAVHESGAVILGTATTADEARQLEAAGFSAVIAQGAEAGGHRASWSDREALIARTELLAQCLEAVKLPVVASGGIMHGRDVADMLHRGAAGVLLGTAFLCCPETDLLPVWREAILAGSETVLTRTLTGKLARAVRNGLIDRMEPHEPELPGFPYVAELTARLRAWAAAHGEKDFLPLMAGCGTKAVRQLPAAELITTLVREVDQEGGWAA
jgi:nitronate monooxygenase